MKYLTIDGKRVRVRALRGHEIVKKGDYTIVGKWNGEAMFSVGDRADDWPGFPDGRKLNKGNAIVRPLPAKKAKPKKRVIEHGDYHKGLLRIASILENNLSNDHKIGMIDSVLFALLITPLKQARKVK